VSIFGVPVVSTITLDSVNKIDDFVSDIANRVEKLKEHDVLERYDIGKDLLTIFNDKSGKYGVDPKTSIEDIMPMSKEALRHMLVIAQEYTREEVIELLNIKSNSSNESLTWTHIFMLAREKDHNRLFEMARNTVSEGWSAKRLNKEIGKVIKTKSNKIRKIGSGRKYKKHNNLRDCLFDVITRCRSVTNAAEQTWVPPGGLQDLYTTNGSSGDTVKEIKDAIESLERLSTIAIEPTLVILRSLLAKANGGGSTNNVV